jgi:hypothetical protein
MAFMNGKSAIRTRPLAVEVGRCHARPAQRQAAVEVRGADAGAAHQARQESAGVFDQRTQQALQGGGLEQRRRPAAGRLGLKPATRREQP